LQITCCRRAGDRGAGDDQQCRYFGDQSTFVFRREEGNGDRLIDFDGKGAAVGDKLRFEGYGSAAAGAFVQVDATHWQINSADGLVRDQITLLNGAAVHGTDFFFV
jgi:hypothetical protein